MLEALFDVSRYHNGRLLVHWVVYIKAAYSCQETNELHRMSLWAAVGRTWLMILF